MEFTMEMVLIAGCLVICGSAIGWLVGYNQGAKDIGNIYKEVYEIKDR